MRLKGQKVQGALMSNRNSSANLDENNNGDLLNGSSASCSSASAIGAHDDLDNAVDSADDEIDVGTNADSIEFNANSANTSAALSGINNDHQFGIFNSQSLNYSSSLISHPHMSQSSCNSMTEADRKRAHHNALERKRRDHIKDSFHTLRDAIPNIKGEKTSRAQILKAATDYIRLMRNRNVDYQNDIDSLKKQNNDIESQIKQLEKAKQVASQYLKQQQMGDQTANMNLSDDLDDVKDFKFDLADVKPTIVQTAPIVSSTTLTTNALTTHHVLTKTSPNTTTTTTTGTPNTNTNTTNTTNPTNGSNSLLILNKTITPTITTLSASAAANSKKFKTIINTKNNINIINLNNPSASAATTIKTLNSSSLGANSTSSSANSSSLANNDFL